ncbi:MAG TPA: tetratricopeptide repeat protein, partial [Pyrinomonadaceae bacterium]|nr:tetratricopeptide repeat protein [Pyrinomonadaceae bacterium]
VWRLVDRALGHEAFMGVLKSQLQTGSSDLAGLNLRSLRAALAERGGATLKTVLNQELDQPTDTDLMIGMPVQRGAQWVSALRNLGQLDVTVTVIGTTESGQSVTTQATVQGRSFGEAVFNSSSRIVRAEIDPEKIYPQVDYSNDVQPHAKLPEEVLSEITQQFARQEFAQAEANARSITARYPHMQEAHLALGRALLGQNKLDEAEREFKSLLDDPLPTSVALAWANIGLGEIALRRGQAAEAVRRYNEAVRTDAEYASNLTARAGRIKAEAAANSAPAVDESARTFITQLDQVIKTGGKAGLDAVIVPGQMVKFVKGIIGGAPEIWQTRVVRTEQLDANHVAADVGITAKQFGSQGSGTAVLVLARIGGAWKLESIEQFEVH